MKRRMIDAEQLLDNLDQQLPSDVFLKVLQVVNGCDTVEQKPSEQMFREIGYHPSPSEAPYPYYTDGAGVHIEICTDGDCGVAKYETIFGYGVRFLPFNVEEILAVAKAIEELEGRA